jgi:hypothetical protein
MIPVKVQSAFLTLHTDWYTNLYRNLYMKYFRHPQTETSLKYRSDSQRLQSNGCLECKNGLDVSHGNFMLAVMHVSTKKLERVRNQKVYDLLLSTILLKISKTSIFFLISNIISFLRANIHSLPPIWIGRMSAWYLCVGMTERPQI